MLTPQLMLCLCTHSLSLRAGIADSHDYAGLHTHRVFAYARSLLPLLLKMNKWVLLRFESGSNLDSSCKICACSRCPTCELFRSEPGLVRRPGHSFQHLHSSVQQVQSGFTVKVAQDTMQLQPSNRGSIYVLQALIEAPPTVTLLSPLQLSIVGKVLASTSRF